MSFNSSYLHLSNIIQGLIMCWWLQVYMEMVDFHDLDVFIMVILIISINSWMQSW